MGKISEFLETKQGRITAWVGTTIALLAMGYSIYSHYAQDAARISANRVFIDSENLRSFDFELKAGMMIPVSSPYSGKNTGYPAELCYWTKEGTAKDTPTPVLLNSYKGSHDPTFCPDCGRLVIAHNPHPMPNSKPPPTAQEYRAKFSQEDQ